MPADTQTKEVKQSQRFLCDLNSVFTVVQVKQNILLTCKTTKHRILGCKVTDYLRGNGKLVTL